MSNNAAGEVRFNFEDTEALRTLLGVRDANLRLLAKTVGVEARSRGGGDRAQGIYGGHPTGQADTNPALRPHTPRVSGL